MIDVDIIKQARQADLPTYLARKGEHLKKDGAGYCLTEHDSLKINGNMYHWFSRGTSGNALDFVREYYGLDFKAAVEELTGTPAAVMSKPISQGAASAFTPKITELPKRADLGAASASEKRVIAYLVKKRGLDYGLVADMIKRGFIYQSDECPTGRREMPAQGAARTQRNTNGHYGNCVFIIKDFINRGNIGYELTGTTDKRFKRISAHRGFGFNLRIGDSVDNIFLFESAIDLLSYYQLHRPSSVTLDPRPLLASSSGELSACKVGSLDKALLVSMGGVNMSVADNLAGIFPEAGFTCCTDNDSAGNDFYEKLRGRYGNKVTRHAPQDAKDWNDYLKGRLGQG